MSFSNNTGAACNGAAANSRNRNVINRISSNEWTLSDLSKFDNYEYKKFSPILGGAFRCFTAMNTRIGFLFDALLWVAYLSAEQNQINDLTTYRPISGSGHSGEWSSKRSTGFEFKRKT